MNFFTDSNHPNVHDRPQGTTVFWSEDSIEEKIEVLTWTNWAPRIDEYNATRARFSVNRDTKTLSLEHVNIKQKYSPWNETLTNPARFISDRMKRAVREFIAQETGSHYWRVELL